MARLVEKSAHNIVRWAAVLMALIVTIAGILQSANIKQAYADDGGYPWGPTSAGTTCVDNTNDCSGATGTYDWGYKLTSGQCPSVDTSCLTDPYPNSISPTAGMGDPWHMDVRNCTSYVAWKLNQVFSANIISVGWGNASNWNNYATSHSYTDDPLSSPQVGDIAQWNSPSPFGHVAYVYKVSGSTAYYDQYNYAENGTFDGSQTSVSQGQPDHYIHIGTPSGGGGGSNPPSTPVVYSADANDMSVFYNDGSNNIVNWSWNVSGGWNSYTWTNPGGSGVDGQPDVISHTSGSMDLFYRDGSGDIWDMSWTSSGGWNSPVKLVTGGVAGDPTAIARDSSDMQLFWRDTSGNIKTDGWNASSGWTGVQPALYNTASTTDPYAITRGSDSMEVFFGKNNGNIVHLGWTSEYGWNTYDWGTYDGVASKPTAITRNGGGDMSTYFQQNDGYIGEQAWDWQTGWSNQYWSAQATGNPSATAGVNNVIDDFYRETGGNIVDRYFTGAGWYTINIVGSNSSTGNPFAITRGSSDQEVFFWNGSNLEDANWDSGRQAWNTATIN